VPPSVRDVWQRLRARDPNGFAVRRAVRAAVVVPANFAIGSQLVGSAQVATFAAFGSFALLIFVTFPGGWRSRLGAHLVLALTGAVLICIGTVVASPDWLAVTAMFVVAFVVLFAGVVSSTINGGTQAALLAFILAVMLPGSTDVLPDRLAGWGIAAGVAIPIALLVWPPKDQDLLRERTAGLCRALAGMLRLDQPPPGSGDSLVALRRATRELGVAYRASAARTAALSTGARLLVRLVDELEWLSTTVTNACADAPEQWPQQGQRLRAAAARLLVSCAEVLVHDGERPRGEACDELTRRLQDLRAARSAVADEALEELRATARTADTETLRGEFGRPLYAAHELGYAVSLAANTIAVIAAADSRSWWGRLLGRGFDAPNTGSALVQVTSGHLDRHSVWLQSSVRAAAGLAGAVLVSRVVDAQNAFWIGLGALSVLRSNALATGATAVRALVGTGVGFAIGGVVVGVLGTSRSVLWPLLPIIIVVAAAAPAIISFVAGQAAFTVFTIVLFNSIAPEGWRIGVVRVEDVALGCAVSLVAGFLFWPRGAAASLSAALSDAYAASASFLRAAIHAVTRTEPVGPASLGATATAAGLRLDDALRQYLTEKGPKHVPLETVARLANGATRLRLAGAAIEQLRVVLPGGPDDDDLREPAGVLLRRGDAVTEWYTRLAAEVSGRNGSAPEPYAGTAADSFIDVVLPAVERCGDPDRAAGAERLLWSGQYLGDVDQLRPFLVQPATEVAAARARPWWRR
jgi:uncharacterized membrane protein YccC